MAVLLPDLASLTPFAPFITALVCNLHHGSRIACGAPTALRWWLISNFTEERETVGHKAPHPAAPSECISFPAAGRSLCPSQCIHQKPRGTPPFPLHPPRVITLVPSPSKSHLLAFPSAWPLPHPGSCRDLKGPITGLLSGRSRHSLGSC